MPIRLAHHKELRPELMRLKLISAGHQSWPLGSLVPLRRYVGWVGEPELALRPHRSHASLSPSSPLQALHCKHCIARDDVRFWGGSYVSAKTLTGSACTDDDEDCCFSSDP